MVFAKSRHSSGADFHRDKLFSRNTGQSCELKMSQKYQESVNYVSMESIALETDKLKSNLGKD
jgi:hypothetical protein